MMKDEFSLGGVAMWYWADVYPEFALVWGVFWLVGVVVWVSWFDGGEYRMGAPAGGPPGLAGFLLVALGFLGYVISGSVLVWVWRLLVG